MLSSKRIKLAFEIAIVVWCGLVVLATVAVILPACGVANDRATVNGGGSVDQRTASPDVAADLSADVASDRSTRNYQLNPTSGPATAEIDDRGAASPDVLTDKSKRDIRQTVGDGSASATNQDQIGAVNLAIGGGGVIALGVWLYHIRYSNGRLYAFVLNLLRVEQGQEPTFDVDKALPEDKPAKPP